MAQCPECGVEVKDQNLPDHVLRVHRKRLQESGKVTLALQRKHIILLAVVAVAGAGAALFMFSLPEASPNASSGPTDVTVTISGHRYFRPREVTVAPGSTITFVNLDGFRGLPYDQHTVTTGAIDPTGLQGQPGAVRGSGSGIPDGRIRQGLKQGEQFSYTFTEPGTYTFYVAEHPTFTGEGKITVNVQ